MKSTSHYALAAAAGLFAGALAITPAQAADLGGDCCADLEERVAELEATTVRKGNRVVSVQLYGQVNRALMYWDDGEEEDVYNIDNDHSSSRLGFRGTGALKPGWTVGYDVQWNVQVGDSLAISQDEFDANDSNKPVAWDIRRAEVYFDSNRFGRLTIGQGSTASDGTSEVDLGFANYSNDTLYNGGFFLRGGAGATDLTWAGLGTNLDGQSRRERVRYDSPSIYGFILSASAGEDDYWDVALRFSKEWNSIRMAAAIAYSETDDDTGRVKSTEPIAPDTEQINGSFSIMHTPSGLFFTGAAGQRDTDATTSEQEGCQEDFSVVGDYCLNDEIDSFPATVDSAFLATNVGDQASAEFDIGSQDATFYSAKLGIQRNFNGYGATTIFGFYGYYEDFAKGNLVDVKFGEDARAITGSPAFDARADGDVSALQVTSSEVDRWAFGINQTFDSAATDIYLHFEYNEADVMTREVGYNAPCTGGSCTNQPGGESGFVTGDSDEIDTEEWFGVVLGTKISF